jgi:hypothetical protein
MGITIILDGGLAPMHITKWTINTYGDHEGYHKNGKIYQYQAELIKWADFIDTINEIRNWIKNDNIDAVESNRDFAWFFIHESDRTILLLKWPI